MSGEKTNQYNSRVYFLEERAAQKPDIAYKSQLRSSNHQELLVILKLFCLIFGCCFVGCVSLEILP